MSLMHKILAWDYEVFYAVHIRSQNALCDFILPFVRNQYFWAPLYVFILVVVYQQYGKKGLLWCLWLLVTFACADFISASVLKPIFARARPCMDPQWYGIVRHIVPISTGPSMPSTHATNHFAISTFMIVTLSHVWSPVRYWALLWASLVAFAQVYVGVHYPSDVFVGALLGVWVGYITGNYVNLRARL
jgi:membrane-associated phospholipid phosphatase